MLRKNFVIATVMLMGLALSACSVPDMAQREESISLTGVVRGIDRPSRRMVVEGSDRTILYRVSDEVRNFDQIEVGDRISLEFQERVAVAMADPEDTGEPLVDVFGARAPEGQRPGALGASVTTLVVDFIDYDPRSHVARIRNPAGEIVSVRVAEELRRFASTREPGDRILIVVEEAVAVQVTPAG